MISNYTVESLSLLFTKFLKIINYMFDGNSTLNENEFLGKIFLSDEIISVLKDHTLYLPLRVELIKFYRLTYMDIIIDTIAKKEISDTYEVCKAKLVFTNEKDPEAGAGIHGTTIP